MLLIMMPDQYPNYYKALQIYSGYFDSLDNMILLPYPSSIAITRDYCIGLKRHARECQCGASELLFFSYPSRYRKNKGYGRQHGEVLQD